MQTNGMAERFSNSQWASSRREVCILYVPTSSKGLLKGPFLYPSLTHAYEGEAGLNLVLLTISKYPLQDYDWVQQV